MTEKAGKKRRRGRPMVQDVYEAIAKFGVGSLITIVEVKPLVPHLNTNQVSAALSQLAKGTAHDVLEHAGYRQKDGSEGGRGGTGHVAVYRIKKAYSREELFNSYSVHGGTRDRVPRWTKELHRDQSERAQLMGLLERLSKDLSAASARLAELRVRLDQLD